MITLPRIRSTAGARAVTAVGVVPIGCVIGLVLLLGAGSLTWRTSPGYGHQAHAAGSVDRGTIPVAVQSSSGQPTVGHAISPTRIEVPALHASAPIVKVATTPDDELDVPQDPKTVGWWSPGARPGAAKGTAILAGHINYAGVQGALGRIGSLKPGDTFVIDGTSINSGAKKSITFAVKGVRTYHKARLPYQTIFDQSSIGRVALVTCGGPFDNATGNYLDNIVVFGVPKSDA